MPYYPQSKYSKPKKASLGAFAEKLSQEPYKGSYVKTSDSKYYSGKSPMDTGIELEKVTNNLRDTVLAVGMGILGATIAGFFKKKLTQSEKEKGVAKRYFVQDKNNNKIVETDKATYLQTQKEVPNRNFAEVDWIIQGPAEDMMFGEYPYEGAESKNKKTIQALDPQMNGISSFISDYKYLVEDPATLDATSQMKGISTFITDYKYLIEDPSTVATPEVTSQTFIQPEGDTQLENSRKANFDLRK